MNIEKFSNTSDLVNRTEIEKVEYLAFYHSKVSGIDCFTIRDICAWFEALSFAKPNSSRLKKRLMISKEIVRGAVKDSFKLHAKAQKELEKELPVFVDNDETIETIDSIIPNGLYSNTRGYIESLSKQINAAYENNIFDGCAVLMRRLLEILLILSYEKIGIQKEIADTNGLYKNLASIIDNCIINSKLSLSKNAKGCLHEFRKLGNFSAHGIHYNAKKPDIRNVALDFRATVEELLYKSGLRT